MTKTEKIAKWLTASTWGCVVSYGSLHLVETRVYTYDKLIGRISREEKTATVCTKTFSVTSSGHRNRLIEALVRQDYTITIVDDPEVV